MQNTEGTGQAQITLIDAAALDEDQFNHLISDLDARHPIIPLLLTCLVILAGASFLA
ncbi:MAG: hypothetical protein R2849_09635 [Thermomicrobiales bacterium]